MKSNGDDMEVNKNKIVLTEKPLTGIRKIIGKRMQESLSTSPQATVSSTYDVSKIIELKKNLSSEGVDISFVDIFVKIVAKALELNPELNSSKQDNKIIVYKSINIGVAVAFNNLLFVPVIKEANNKNLIQISKEIKQLIHKIKSNTIDISDISDGTFTVSNMGMFDIEVMTPIINLPEAAILSIGKIKKSVVAADDDTINIKPMAVFSLTIDHSVVDGTPAAKFLETIKTIMFEPENYVL